MKLHQLFMPAVLSALLVTACSSDEPGGNSSAGVKLSPVEIGVCENMEPFNMAFFRAACEVSAPSQNVLISPLSASMFLGMRANYSSEESSKKILTALGCDNLDDVNSFNSKLLRQLKGLDKKTTINLANSVWYDSKYSVVPEAADRLKSYFAADFFSCDPTSTATGRKITDWVAAKSDNCIHFTAKDFTYLVMNVLYFNGVWKQQFNAKDTRTEHFYGRDKGSAVDMMYSKDTFNEIAFGPDFNACRKAFGNGAYTCTFVLPDSEENFDEFVSGFTADKLSGLTFVNQQSSLIVPKFELVHELGDFNSVLKKMGMDDFSGSILEGYDASPVFMHKTYFSINEKGAKVSSITVETDLISPGYSNPTIRLNRPFIFFINETSTGACIAAGKIANL